MEELIKRLTEKGGLSPEAATMAINTVLGFLKERLPEPVAAQIESVLGGSTQGGQGGMLGGIGKLFGQS